MMTHMKMKVPTVAATATPVWEVELVDGDGWAVAEPESPLDVSGLALLIGRSGRGAMLVVVCCLEWLSVSGEPSECKPKRGGQLSSAGIVI